MYAEQIMCNNLNERTIITMKKAYQKGKSDAS